MGDGPRPGPPGWAQAGPSRPPPAGGFPAGGGGLVEALDPLRSSFLDAERCLLAFYIYPMALWVGWYLETTSQSLVGTASQPPAPSQGPRPNPPLRQRPNLSPI